MELYECGIIYITHLIQKVKKIKLILNMILLSSLMYYSVEPL